MKQRLEAKKRERQRRLEELVLRERNEIPSLEQEVQKIEGQIANLDKNQQTLQAQQRSLPSSFGIPRGTRFQPGIPREVRGIEMQARQRWEALQREFARARAELQGNLRLADARLREKRAELRRERGKILANQ
jgi:hypothetical protein